MAPTTQRPLSARDRLLGTAGELFYAEGIHSVGVDRVVAEAKVTKSTFYRHFPSKDELVVAYLESTDAQFKQWFDHLASENDDPAELLRAIFEGLAANLYGTDFRGCHFINAAAEDSRVDSAIRAVVIAHRAWFKSTLRRLLLEAGFDPADAMASHLVALRDGAMVEGYLDSPEAAGQTLLKGFEIAMRNPALLA